MSRFRKSLALSALLVCLAGCASQTNKEMQSWVGHNINELVASWGQPQEVTNLTGGDRLFVWSSVRSFTTPGSATTTTTALGTGMYTSSHIATMYNPPVTSSYYETRTFWVNSQGVIYRWAWRGL